MILIINNYYYLYSLLLVILISIKLLYCKVKNQPIRFRHVTRNIVKLYRRYRIWNLKSY